ncbi:MAG TPA: outer membrane beta-barrel protein, partial [Aquella sp.]|nr:outer membrane beta-barrel protein [Aquella sp.]
MQKILCGLFLSISSCAFADLSGLFVGGGLGYGTQSVSAFGSSTTLGTPSIKAFVGYQMADWIGAEAGYTYITQASNWNNLGAPSTTVYDLAFTPGFPIPATPVTIYGRVGIDAVSPNL